jgi:hypothetical protein
MSPRRCERTVALIGVALTASCGRWDFEARTTDARLADAVADSPAQVPALVHLTSATTGTSANFASLPVSIPQVTAGNLVVVATSLHGGESVTAVSDNLGTTFTSAGRAVSGSTASEIWYATTSGAAATVTVQVSPADHFDVWVGEFSGTKAAPPTVAMGCLQYPPSIVQAAGATTVPNELIVSVTMLAAPLYVDPALAPFNGFPSENGNSGGYLVAPTPGSYATTFPITSGAGMTAMTCATTATWMPGP